METRGMERWTGLIMVGDGLAGLIWPREYLRKLEIGPTFVNNILEAFAERPMLTRTLCVVEMALGAWVLVRRPGHFGHPPALRSRVPSTPYRISRPAAQEALEASLT